MFIEYNQPPMPVKPIALRSHSGSTSFESVNLRSGWGEERTPWYTPRRPGPETEYERT